MRRSEFLKTVVLAVVLIGMVGTLSGCGGSCPLTRCKIKQASFAVVEDPKAAITDTAPARWVLQWTAQKDHAGPVDIDIRVSHYNMSWKKIESADGRAELVWAVTKRRGRSKRDSRSKGLIAQFRIA
ncbi:MAG: hypothetical protein ACYST9_04735, partial [Planctomycetota bacterium]